MLSSEQLEELRSKLDELMQFVYAHADECRFPLPATHAIEVFNQLRSVTSLGDAGVSQIRETAVLQELVHFIEILQERLSTNYGKWPHLVDCSVLCGKILNLARAGV